MSINESNSAIPKAFGIMMVIVILSMIAIFFMVLSSEEDGVIRDIMLDIPILQDMVSRKKVETDIQSFNEEENFSGEVAGDSSTSITSNTTDIEVGNIVNNSSDQDIDILYLSPSEVMREGEKAFLNLKLKDAKDIFMQNQDTDPVANYYLGLISSFEHDLNSVRAYFNRITELGGEEKIVIKSKEILKAFDEYNLYSGSTEDHLEVLLGRAYLNLGFTNLGIVKLKDAVKINPEYKDAYVLLGAAYMMLKDYGEAINYLTKALPTDRSEPNYYLGLAYFNQGKYQESILSFREAAELGYYPEIDLRKKLGEALLAVGKNSEAVKEFDRVIEINPLDASLYYQPIWVNLKLIKDVKKALYYAELSLSNNPKLALPHDYIGWVYLEASQYDMAKKYLDAALSIDPNLASAHFHIARYYENFSDLLNAEQHYQKVVEIDPYSEYGKDAEKELRKYL